MDHSQANLFVDENASKMHFKSTCKCTNGFSHRRSPNVDAKAGFKLPLPNAKMIKRDNSSKKGATSDCRNEWPWLWVGGPNLFFKRAKDMRD